MKQAQGSRKWALLHHNRPNMNPSSNIEAEILNHFEAQQASGVLHVGLIIGDDAHARLLEHLVATGKVAVRQSAQRSRIALIPVFRVEEYAEPGYRIGPLEDISREWRNIMEDVRIAAGHR